MKALWFGLAAVVLTATASSAQVRISGIVTDSSGRPLADADLDFFETQSGAKVDPSAPGWEGQSDRTDLNGRYELVVVPEVYDIRFEPNVDEIGVAPVFERDVILGTDLVLNVQLPDGARLSGRVTGPNGDPVGTVDLDVRDPDTGTKIATIRDDTDADGFFDLTVRFGEWDVLFRPPEGSGAGGSRVSRVDLTVGRTLDVQLPRGYVVTGRVERFDGIPIRLADLDFDDVDRRTRAPVSGDATSADGRFRVVVPEGTHHVSVSPPPGLPLAPATRAEVAVFGDVDLGTITLETGVLLQGDVETATGAPIADANVDLFEAGTCRRYPATTGTSNASGQFTVRVLPGRYDVRVIPTKASGVAGRAFTDLEFSADGSETFVLTDTPNASDPILTLVRTPDGAPATGATIRATPIGVGIPFEVVVAEDGTATTAASPGPYRIEVFPGNPAGLPQLVLNSVELPCGLPPELTLTTLPAPGPDLRTPLRVYPNPSKTSTSFSFSLEAVDPNVTLSIHDVTGRRVALLHEGRLAPGAHEFFWDGRTPRGYLARAGVYFVRMHSVSQTGSAKIMRTTP